MNPQENVIINIVFPKETIFKNNLRIYIIFNIILILLLNINITIEKGVRMLNRK